MTLEGLRQHNDTWNSPKSSCVSCQCLYGVATCSELSCASCSSEKNLTAAVVDRCCSQCRQTPSSSSSSRSSSSSNNRPSHSKCRHQELANTTFDSGRKWIYQCQSCECMVKDQIKIELIYLFPINNNNTIVVNLKHGETDCWPMECPPVYCRNPVRVPGDCCPRCPDDDPCSAADLMEVELTSSASEEPLGCHYQGTNYTQGSEWAAGLDGCTTCKCKVRDIRFIAFLGLFLKTLTITKTTITSTPTL